MLTHFSQVFLSYLVQQGNSNKIKKKNTFIIICEHLIHTLHRQLFWYLNCFISFVSWVNKSISNQQEVFFLPITFFVKIIYSLLTVEKFKDEEKRTSKWQFFQIELAFDVRSLHWSWEESKSLPKCPAHH